MRARRNSQSRKLGTTGYWPGGKNELVEAAMKIRGNIFTGAISNDKIIYSVSENTIRGHIHTLLAVFIEGEMASFKGIVGDYLACNEGCSMMYAKKGCGGRIDARKNQ